MSTPTQTPAIAYDAIQRVLAAPAGPPRRRFPLPQSSPIQFAAYAFDQEFEMLLANFPPAPKNTPSNAVSGSAAVFAGLMDGNAILTKLSQPSPTGGGKGKFTGSFARVPASWDDFVTQMVNYPGWINTITGALGFRDALPRQVTIRMHYDYFVVDPAAVLTGASVVDSGGAAVTAVISKGAIPQLLKTPWLAMYSASGGAPWTPILNDEAKALVPAAGVSGYYPTLPTIEQYQAWCVIAAAFLAAGSTWDATHPPVWGGASQTDVTAGQYRLEDSRLVEYEGNIIARMTPYAMPR